MVGLVLTSLDRQRATILIDEFLRTRDSTQPTVLSPTEVAAQERLLWRDRGAPAIELGSRFRDTVSDTKTFAALTSGCEDAPPTRRRSACVSSARPRRGRGAKYLVNVDGANIRVCLHRSAGDVDLFRAFFNAVALRFLLNRTAPGAGGGASATPEKERRTLWAAESAASLTERFFPALEQRMAACGWTADHVNMNCAPWRAEWEL